MGTEGLPRDSGGAPGRLRSVEQVSSPDRLGHGNSILKNEQQVFTLSVNLGNTWGKLDSGSGNVRRFGVS